MSLDVPTHVALSVVVPAHDEALNLERLAHDVRVTLDPRGIIWELIIVDDGSTDETGDVLGRLAAADPRIRHLRLPTRSGQTAALVAGFHAARGRLIATLDADLQCPPRELPVLLTALGEADLACGVRTARRDPLRRRIVSGLTNFVRRCVLAPRLRDLACPLRVFRSEALAQLETMIPLFDGAHRWLPALFVLGGLRVVQRPVTHEPRRAGVSKYTATGRAGPIAREAGRVFGIALQRRPGLRILVALTAMAALAVPLLYRLGRWPLTEPDEGRNAEVAREMLQLGTWSIPHFNYLPYLDKPVLFFWILAAMYRAVGVSELAARLPSVLSAIATIALTFAIARALLDARRAAVAALVIATTPLVLVFGRAVVFDMLLTALVTTALYALLQARRSGDTWRWWPLAGVTIGLAVLCKGPVGAAVPLLAWCAGRSALPPMPRRTTVLPAAAALLLAMVIVLPWLALVRHVEPSFLRYALVDETLRRMTTSAGFGRGGPPYYYAGVLPWAAGAWSVLLLALAPPLMRRWRAGGADAHAIAFTARAAAALVVFFSLLSSKRPQYILPALVPMAVLIAAGVDAAPRRVAQTVRALGCVALVIGVAATIAVRLDFTPTHGHLRVVTPPVVGAIGLTLVAWGLLATVSGRRPFAALACAALLAPALGLRLLAPLGPYAESRSARSLARNVPADSKVVCLQTFHTSLPFYLRRPVLLVSRDAHELTSRYVTAMHDRFMGGPYLQPVERFADVIADRDVVVLTKKRTQVTRLAKRPFVALYSQRRSVLLQPAS
jgi:4-amino-4-deoxy-L-arabinose transferase-like glycosyltransferase